MFSLQSLAFLLPFLYLCIVTKLIKLFYSHCSLQIILSLLSQPLKKMLIKFKMENLKLIKNALPNKSGNPERLIK